MSVIVYNGLISVFFTIGLFTLVASPLVIDNLISVITGIVVIPVITPEANVKLPSAL